MVPHSWENLPEEKLLELRVCDLKLKIEDSELSHWILELNNNLKSQSIEFYPPCYLADEWFVLEGEVAIGIPFYLAHPRLKKLEEKMMLEVEGGSHEDFLKLLRHEAGHALYYAYGFDKKKEVSKIFGPPSSEETPQHYRPKPYSKSYVRHLNNWYAQAEPDEDFAETFAVWLSPQLDWKTHYKGWPALKKLQCMEEWMNQIRGKPPLTTEISKDYSAQKLRLKLKTYYARKQKLYAQDYPDFYDRDLKRIFAGDQEAPGELAASFMRRHHRHLVNKVSEWTGEKKFIVDNLFKKLQDRCRNLKIRVEKNETETLMELTAYLTSMASNYIYTGKFKPSV